MPEEIERKYLIKTDELTLPENGEDIKQGYFPMSDSVKTVVRIRVKGDAAYLTIKGKNKGAVRSEYEYVIPKHEAEEMLETMCQKPFIDKTRYEITVGAHVWEVDVFRGENLGLVIAEIELSKETEDFAIPNWISEEVTGDPRYYNSSLLHHPYLQWDAI